MELNKFTKQRVKRVERNGARMEHVLCKSDPWGDPKCRRYNCFMCLTSTKDVGKCRKTNILYNITCLKCLEKGDKTQYWGESSRSGYMRVAEHRQDLFNLDEGSHMMRHMMKFHTEVDLENPENRKAEKFFKMEMVRQFRTAMDRQISEALAIARSGGMESTSVMNNFDEYNRCILPELQTSNEIKMKERAKRAREVETQENPKLCKRARKTPTPGTNRHQAEQKGGTSTT